jgi:molybdate transport system substrate-binding protein
MLRTVPTLLVRVLLGVLLGVLPGFACGGEEPSEKLVVFAAASTADVLTRIAEEYEGAQVQTSFGPSSGLARQIADGAPADIYISASRSWVEYLLAADALREAPRVFCRNRLVCVAPAASTLIDAGLGRARELPSHLARGDRIAIADAGVPAGEYARMSLAATGDLDALRGYLVAQPCVRSVLRAVESGEAAAGFVYATDARVAEVVVLFPFDPATHEPIEYFAALPGTARSLEASRAFLDHLRSARTREILREAGFETAR